MFNKNKILDVHRNKMEQKDKELEEGPTEIGIFRVLPLELVEHTFTFLTLVDISRSLRYVFFFI